MLPCNLSRLNKASVTLQRKGSQGAVQDKTSWYLFIQAAVSTAWLAVAVRVCQTHLTRYFGTEQISELQLRDNPQLTSGWEGRKHRQDLLLIGDSQDEPQWAWEHLQHWGPAQAQQKPLPSQPRVRQSSLTKMLKITNGRVNTPSGQRGQGKHMSGTVKLGSRACAQDTGGKGTAPTRKSEGLDTVYP